MTQYSPFLGRVNREPARLELVEVAWRMRAPSGRILECGIYLTAAGFEARMGYGDNLLASQFARTLPIAREHADGFRVATAANPRFTPAD